MFCENCGKQIDDDAKFCKYCGASIELKAETVSNENSEQKVSAVRDSASDYTSSVKIKSYIIIAVIIAVPIILIIAVLLLMSLSDKKNFEKNEEEIQKVQDSYFEFLPEMTVGDLLYEYYGEDYWAYNVDNVVEFWGTNQKDKSGLALNFDSVKADNTVGVTYRMYHEENEAAHSISEEEFEEYILSLYAQLDDNYRITDITTKSETTPTTTAKVTTTTVTTTVTKEQDKVEESKYYLAYLMFLNEMNASIKREYGDIYVPYYQYYLYDINHDGFYELILHVGESEADASILFYTIDEESEDGFIELGEFGGGHTVLVEKDGKLYTDYGHSGHQIVEEVMMMEDLGSWIIVKSTLFEKENLSEYIDYGTAIKGYDISDTSAIEALCPKELLEDEPYINNLETPSIYIETKSVPIAINGMGEETYDYTNTHNCDVVNWKSIPNADGYEVSYVVHTGYASEGTEQVYNETKTVYENTFVYGNLTSHLETEYSSTSLWHLSVRAFSVTDDGVIYSDWSNEVTAIWE